MQKTTIKNQLKQQITELKKFFDLFEQQEHLTHYECEQFLEGLNLLNRNLAVYAHFMKQNAVSSDIDVHLKIMQAVEKKEEVKQELALKITPPPVAEKTADEEKDPKAEEWKSDSIVNTKKIEIAINDKYRIINELFGMNPAEFNAAIQQLNAINTWEETLLYLNSLKSVYNWKDNNDLVKIFYGIAQKRFA